MKCTMGVHKPLGLLGVFAFNVRYLCTVYDIPVRLRSFNTKGELPCYLFAHRCPIFSSDSPVDSPNLLERRVIITANQKNPPLVTENRALGNASMV
jgi:hypothetical protein